jgi:hypothetical protein
VVNLRCALMLANIMMWRAESTFWRTWASYRHSLNITDRNQLGCD